MEEWVSAAFCPIIRAGCRAGSIAFGCQQEEANFQQRQQAFYDLQNQLERHSNKIQANQQLQENVTEQLLKLQAEIAIQQEEKVALAQALEEKQQQASAAEQIFQQQQITVEEQKQQLQQLEDHLQLINQQQEENKAAVFSVMQAQAHNRNALLRLEQELSGGGRSKEKLEQKVDALRQESGRTTKAERDFTNTISRAADFTAGS